MVLHKFKLQFFNYLISWTRAPKAFVLIVHPPSSGQGCNFVAIMLQEEIETSAHSLLDYTENLQITRL